MKILWKVNLSFRFAFIIYFVIYWWLYKIFRWNPISRTVLQFFIILKLCQDFFLLGILLILYIFIIIIIVLAWLRIIFPSHIFVFCFAEIIDTLLLIKYMNTIISTFFFWYWIWLLVFFLIIYYKIRYLYSFVAIRKLNSDWCRIKWWIIG